jgi:hypothetical protein
VSEFSSSDIREWLHLSVMKNCSIYKAINYIYYFNIDDKAARAYKYFLNENNISPKESKND